MDPVNVIRAPSLKRGKPDERLSDRVSIELTFIRVWLACNEWWNVTDDVNQTLYSNREPNIKLNLESNERVYNSNLSNRYYYYELSEAKDYLRKVFWKKQNASSWTWKKRSREVLFSSKLLNHEIPRMTLRKQESGFFRSKSVAVNWKLIVLPFQFSIKKFSLDSNTFICVESCLTARRRLTTFPCYRPVIFHRRLTIFMSLFQFRMNQKKGADNSIPEGDLHHWLKMNVSAIKASLLVLNQRELSLCWFLAEIIFF